VAEGDAHGHTAVCKKYRLAEYYYLCTEENCEQESSTDSVAPAEHAELSGSGVESPAAFYGEVRLSAGVPAWSHPWTGHRSFTGPHRDKRDEQPCKLAHS